MNFIILNIVLNIMDKFLNIIYILKNLKIIYIYYSVNYSEKFENNDNKILLIMNYKNYKIMNI